MPKAKSLLSERLEISQRFHAILEIYEVERDYKYPEGIKVSFVLLDVIQKVPRLIIDNHAPFGFHVHEELPANKNKRRMLLTKNYVLVLNEFWKLIKEIINAEN